MKRLFTLAAACSALAFTASVAAQDVTIINAKLAIGDGSEPINGGVIRIRGGTIVLVDSGDGETLGSSDDYLDVSRRDASGQPLVISVPVIDAKGAWVTPGIFAAVTDIGVFDVSGVRNSNDGGASDSRFSAALDISQAINPASEHIAVSRAGGVTRATVAHAPGDSIFAGQGATIDLGVDPEPITQARSFQMVVLGERGARIAGGGRTASNLELRNAMAEAQAYVAGAWEGEDALLTRPDVQSLVPVISGKQKLYIHAERASDIRKVIALKQEFPKLDIVLLGASEGWLAANALAASGIPVIADPLDDLPSSFEQLAATQSNVGRMRQAGVKVAIGGIGAFEQPRNLTQYAGNLVALSKVPRASGLTWGQAFASITSIPAEISGLGGKAGILQAGAMGDVVMWDGDPLELSSNPTRVFIDGIEQPLSNHQTRLRDRYRDLDESDLPKAYDW
ncbi:amidohydrolase family protein [Pontixanthobacter aestiaquae]|uniref:Amidohydrolase family protein n=1 Tax=Pontixanthobacter aestiaquae TaxID=1509367 RepID=A0A844Z8J5_9SPHN|nr:amidohydrolase family protein [Pontixanthobacter aestiaquae]MDN3646789.1 amidohydrolase family protein [Pontixanthobacter aestiaquae]MXO82229.1 amidohydrolase family protein [Pontixanthobacter aestiaquae]